LIVETFECKDAAFFADHDKGYYCVAEDGGTTKFTDGES
jgi:hypothetical protein